MQKNEKSDLVSFGAVFSIKKVDAKNDKDDKLIK